MQCKEQTVFHFSTLDQYRGSQLVHIKEEVKKINLFIFFLSCIGYRYFTLQVLSPINSSGFYSMMSYSRIFEHWISAHCSRKTCTLVGYLPSHRIDIILQLAGQSPARKLQRIDKTAQAGASLARACQRKIRDSAETCLREGFVILPFAFTQVQSTRRSSWLPNTTHCCNRTLQPIKRHHINHTRDCRWGETIYWPK